MRTFIWEQNVEMNIRLLCNQGWTKEFFSIKFFFIMCLQNFKLFNAFHQCLPCVFGKLIHASTNLHLQDQIMVQNYYPSHIQFLYYEYNHVYKQSWFCRLYPFAIAYKGFEGWKIKIGRFQNTFLHPSSLLASLQNVIFSHLRVHVQFT